MNRVVAVLVLCLALFSLCGCASIELDSSEIGQDDIVMEVSDTPLTDEDLPWTSRASGKAFEAGESEEMVRVQEDIERIASESDMNVSVAVVDLTTGEYAGFQGDSSVISASMTKMIIAAAFLDRVQSGEFSLDGEYTVQDSDIVGGSGSLQNSGSGTTVTYRELVMKMISESDNTATNILIDAAGGIDAVNELAQELGLEGTKLYGYFMVYTPDAVDENHASANDLAMLFQMVYDGTFVDEDSSELVMEALLQQTDNAGIPVGLPEGTEFAHKTGTLDNARHDGGIVLGDHPYVLVVLCNEPGFYEEGALSAMQQIAAATYEDIVG